MAMGVWGAPGTPRQPRSSLPSSAAASINTKVFESLSSVRCCQGTGAGVREPGCPVALPGACRCRGGVTQGCWPGAPVAPDRSPHQHRRHHLGRAMVWVRGTGELRHPQSHHFRPPYPLCPPCSRLSILVWQPCIQMRCPSYLHWHRITLLEKSDSATSCLGFTTTWGGRGAGLGALLPCPPWWCPWREPPPQPGGPVAWSPPPLRPCTWKV